MTTFEKPTISSSINGNAYSIMANIKRALERSNQSELAEEFMIRAKESESYDKLIQLTFEYVMWDTPESCYKNEYIEDEDNTKPTLIREQVNGNAYGVIGAVIKALKRSGQNELAEEFNQKSHESESYDALLQLTFQYVNWR